MKVLRARLYEEQRQRQVDERAASRKSQVGSGDRSERIRTYNFPQGRVTDHRINLTLYKLDRVLTGEALDELIDPLIAADQAEKLAELQCAPLRRRLPGRSPTRRHALPRPVSRTRGALVRKSTRLTSSH